MPPPRRGVVTGTAQVLFHGSDGFDYLVKNTAWDKKLRIKVTRGYAQATASGLCAIQQIRRSDSAVVGEQSGCHFALAAWDGNATRRVQPDRFGIQVWLPNGTSWFYTGPPVTLLDGGVTVKAR